MVRVVVVGGGWAGTSAAIAAAKVGAKVTLLERTDMLLGTGLVGGIMRNNGRFTATEEAIAMGVTEIFAAVDGVRRHKDIEFPGHKHASLYDVSLVEPAVKKAVQKAGVEVHLKTRFTDLEMQGDKIVAIIAGDQRFEADVVIDATGSAGPMNNCTKYGNGCAMCILRCPTFGGRVSVAGKAGVKEIVGQKADGSIGAMSGSCKLHKESLAPEIVEELNRTGVAIVPVPKELVDTGKLGVKACQQYALKEFAENIILLDTGHAKLMTPTFPLEKLRKVPGFENARFEDPYAGGIGNSMRYLAMCPRNNRLQVEGVANLFCAGEKSGLLVGHTEAIVTGALAGNNAVRFANGVETMELPTSLAIGHAIAYVKEQMATPEGLGKKYTFSGSVYFEKMKELGLYTTDLETIRKRVEDAGLLNIFAKPVGVTA